MRNFKFTGNSAHISARHLQERTVSTFQSSPMLKPKGGDNLWPRLSLWALPTIDYCADEIRPGISLFIQITLLFSGLWQQKNNKAGSTQNNSGTNAYHTRPQKSLCCTCGTNSDFDGFLETGIDNIW